MNYGFRYNDSAHYVDSPSTSNDKNENHRKSNISGKEKFSMRLMPYPSRNGKSTNFVDSKDSKDRETVDGDKNQQTRFLFGSSPAEQTYAFTGTIDRVIKWHKILQNSLCFYEVIASIVSLQNGSVKLERIILLRDDRGPIMQIVHYLTHNLQLEDFVVGQKLRVVGRMIGYNKLMAISIRQASVAEIHALPRHCHIGDYAISRLVKDDLKATRGNVLLH